MQRLQRFQRLSNLSISLLEPLRGAAPLQHAFRLRRRMLIVRKILQEIPIEETVRRRVRVAFPPRTDRRTALRVRRVRDFGDDFAQIAFELGQVEGEFGAVHVDDDADATGGREKEQLGRQSSRRVATVAVAVAVAAAG